MIYVTGDTHIPTDVSKLNTRRFPAQKQLAETDYVIICGDFGGVWNNDREEYYWRKWLDKKNFTTLFVDGNHENFDLLRTFETVPFGGGTAHKISDRIYHLMRGQIYEIDGKRLFTFGGAASHDKACRTAGINWWAEELPSPDEMAHAVAALTSAVWQVDYIITHCAPSSVQQKIAADYGEDVLTRFLEDIKNKVSFRKWYFGHYHIDRVLEDRFCCLFEQVKPLD
ncbi:MAG: metallophosphatase family protein [Clostridia bacterium]|nr:metallophosphatase family protein [Clostridia bacterium]